MDARPRELEGYTDETTGREPFYQWLMRSCTDLRARDKILLRLDRAEDGNLGDHGPVGEGVWEMRIHYGPGYRVYYGEDGDKIILLTGGTKASQQTDINRAKLFWRLYRA